MKLPQQQQSDKGGCTNGIDNKHQESSSPYSPTSTATTTSMSVSTRHPSKAINNSQSPTTMYPSESHHQQSANNHSVPISNLLFNPSTETHTSFQQQQQLSSLITAMDNSSSIPPSQPRLPAYICIYDNQIISLRYCRICKIYQPPRSYHCSQCNW